MTLCLGGDGRAFVEASNYNKGISQGKIYGYSPNVMNYLQTNYNQNVTWQSRCIIEGVW